MYIYVFLLFFYASLKLRAARIIMARYSSRPMYKLGSIASNIENLFARMLNLYKEVSNLTTFRNKMSQLETGSLTSYVPTLENTINALGIAQSHYHRIRLEKKFFYKALKENAKKDEMNKKRFLKKFGALPPGFQEPTALKGGMHTEYRRKFNNSISGNDGRSEPALEQEPRGIYQRRQEGKSKQPIWKPGPLSDNLQYGDNWKHDENLQASRSFDAAWEPNKNQAMQRSDDTLWQPKEKQDSRRFYDAAWQPSTKRGMQRFYDADWQPSKMQPASRRSFDNAWQPNKKRKWHVLWKPNIKQAMQPFYDATWQPNNMQGSQRSYDAGWQPNKKQNSQHSSNEPDKKYLVSQNVGGVQISNTNRRASQEPDNSGSLLDQRRGAEPFPIKNGVRSKKRVLWKPKAN